MKKFWFVVALAAALSCPVACEKNNPSGQEGGGGSVTPAPTPTPTPAPTPAPTPKPETVRLVVDTDNSSVKFIELTESGTYLVCEIDSQKDLDYSFGSYTVNSDGQFLLGEYAVLTYELSGSPVTFTLKKKDGTTVTGKATPKRDTNLSASARKLCRTWVITKTRVSITETIKANADFTGCNLGEISEFARNQGIEIKKDLSGISLLSITLTPSGSAIIQYSNNQLDVADCDLSAVDKGILKYAWHDASAMGYEFTNGSANVSFQGENCLLSVASDFTKDSKKYGVSVIFVLAEKK